jgi:phenylacetate-CoA ligase
MDLLSALLWRGYFQLRRLPPFWKEMDLHRDLDPAAAKRNLAQRLLSQVRYFGARPDALPEWREAASIRDPDTLWKLWPQLPIVTRHDLHHRFVPREIQQRFGIEGQIGSTGGSTGEPTSYLHDPPMLAAANAARAYCRLRLGWKPGMPVVCVWGSERDIGRAMSVRNRISARLRHDWIVDGYSLDSATADRVFDLIAQKSPVALHGFTSMLEFVAREALRRDIRPLPGAVSAAWNGGEMLYPGQAEVFRKAFGVPLLNLYGGRELSAMAWQPREGSPLIPLRPFLFVEIVDDQGKPAAPGESGRLLWTSTVCRGTPFLRYECGDLGCYDAGDTDESGIRFLRELHGRTAGLIRINGKTISGLFWNHLFKEFPRVEQFQVIVKGERELELRLKGHPFSPEQDQHVRRLLERLAGDAPVRMVWVERMPRSRQGKLEQVIHET